jgi:hypothetical protein
MQSDKHISYNQSQLAAAAAVACSDLLDGIIVKIKIKSGQQSQLVMIRSGLLECSMPDANSSPHKTTRRLWRLVWHPSSQSAMCAL